MNNKEQHFIRPDKEVYGSTVQGLIDHFTQYLLENQKEGYLPGISPKVIETLTRNFAEEKSALLVQHFSQSINAHLKWKEKNLCSKVRQRPFDRLLVKRFSKWFPDTGELVSGDMEVFSRRMLPGLFKSLEMLAGNECQQKVEKDVQGYWDAILEIKENEAQWGDLYRHIEANKAIDRYFAHMAKSFADFNDRVGWLMRSINNGLGQSEKYAFEGEGVWAWTLSEKETLKLLRTLYSPISIRVHDEAKRAEFEAEIDASSIQATYGLLNHLAATK
ncbi:hypothetical protein MTBPR1_90124 [Candidatus Terasakiella magnetica]|uniref:Uncharacterized protein n=1 Tax=Candidatus Terasakiella magnetica TaxID=1867952 RepID=A0A1C3RLW4_9PROT|nr:hypothetical protein [Candidatus Terasakiella magnetica]SCA58277.1 hypothetical protein MTBPR1_90124 [Candidatus Terasakiella magnetica]